jgi:hypothetical protein
LFRGLFQAGDVELFHLEHGFHDPLGGGGVAVVQERE